MLLLHPLHQLRPLHQEFLHQNQKIPRHPLVLQDPLRLLVHVHLVVQLCQQYLHY
jgi:hypothetical protein